jgi:hypothetical protein
MQLIFKYDLDRLNSYSVNVQNNIRIVKEAAYTMLSFPEVKYFNYTFPLKDQPLLKFQLKNIEDFYGDQKISRHKIIIAAECKKSNALLSNEGSYKQLATIAKTSLAPLPMYKPQMANNLQFLKVDHEHIGYFTDIYLQAFEAEERNSSTVRENFETLLNISDLDLYLLKYNENFIGVNILYKTPKENLLAGGAIIPEYRNKGFHKIGLAFRIHQSLSNSDSKSIIAWAYKHSISLQNMIKLKMQVQQEFNVYEYCK